MAAAISDFMAGPGFAKGREAVLGPAEVLQQLLALGSVAAEVCHASGARAHAKAHAYAHASACKACWLSRPLLFPSQQ